MEEQLQALYERATREDMPPTVFAQLAMIIVNQQVAELTAQNEILLRRIAMQQSMLNPMAA